MVPGQQLHFQVQFVNRQEDSLLAFAFRRTELGPVGQDSPVPGLILLGNVDNEGWRHAFEGGGIQDLEGAMRLSVDWQLLKAGKETAFIPQGRGMVVVRMAS